MGLVTGRSIKHLLKSLIYQNDFPIENIITRNFRCTTRVLGNIIPFNLSDIGEGIREVEIKEWFVKEGDKVSQFDNICEVQSDKASVTITSRYDGTIKKIHYNIDQIAHVGKPLVDIEVEEGNKVEVQTDEMKKRTEASEITPIKRNETKVSHDFENDYSLCIPSVRRLAKQYNLDLKNIKGTGKSSRILKEDILNYLKSTNQTNEEKISTQDVQVNEETIKIKSFQKAMSQTMTASLKIPHFVYTEEIKVTELSKLRNTLKSNSDFDLNLSYVPFFIKAISLALLKHPILNSTLDVENENIIIKKKHHIGIAMDTKVGLAVPVIHDVQNKSILEIAKVLKRLMENGKNGNFSVEDLKNGTISFSNIGVIGGLNASPVILSPQVAIIAMGAKKLVPRYNEDLNVVPEEIVNISGAGDHRIIDGATMANFINQVKKYIETPYLLMLQS